jgi:hypothetical protein
VALGVLLAVGVAWSAMGLLVEVRDAAEEADGRGGNALPFFWRFGMAPVGRFARCMAAARAVLPAGAVVAFDSAEGPRDADFFRWRWAAYLLPEQHLVRADDPRARALAGFLLTYRKQVRDSSHPLLTQLPGGRLYRVLPAATGPAAASAPAAAAPAVPPLAPSPISPPPPPRNPGSRR